MAAALTQAYLRKDGLRFGGRRLQSWTPRMVAKLVEEQRAKIETDKAD